MEYLPEGMSDAVGLIAPAGVATEESAGEPTGGVPEAVGPLAPASP